MSENACAEARRGARASTASVVERIVEEDDEARWGKLRESEGARSGHGRQRIHAGGPPLSAAARTEATQEGLRLVMRELELEVRGGGRVRSSGLGREEVDRRRLAGGCERRAAGEAQSASARDRGVEPARGANEVEKKQEPSRVSPFPTRRPRTRLNQSNPPVPVAPHYRTRTHISIPNSNRRFPPT